MTAPKQAVATDRGRFYTDPNPEFDGAMYPSVTNVLATGVAKPALVPWAAKVVAEYAFSILPRLVKASRDPKARIKALKDLKSRAKYVSEEAANRGTRVHAAAEAHELGAPMVNDPEIAGFVEQYLRFIADFQVDLDRDVEASEASVVHRTAGYAGTMDSLMWLPTGPDCVRELWLIDRKTSATRPANSAFPEHVMQLAALRNAETVWLPNGFEAPMPLAQRCAVLNLRENTYALLELPADAKAFAAFKSALATTRYLHGLDLKGIVPVRPPSQLIPAAKGAATS